MHKKRGHRLLFLCKHKIILKFHKKLLKKKENLIEEIIKYAIIEIVGLTGR